MISAPHPHFPPRSCLPRLSRTRRLTATKTRGSLGRGGLTHPTRAAATRSPSGCGQWLPALMERLPPSGYKEIVYNTPPGMQTTQQSPRHRSTLHDQRSTEPVTQLTGTPRPSVRIRPTGHPELVDNYCLDSSPNTSEGGDTSHARASQQRQMAFPKTESVTVARRWWKPGSTQHCTAEIFLQGKALLHESHFPHNYVLIGQIYIFPCSGCAGADRAGGAGSRGPGV